MLGTQVANYRIEERLGEGGMGVVYKATDLNLDRRVALKFLSSDLNRDPGLIQRFQSEARAQANLNHTNIATLYNFINVDGNWLIAMEYVDGETLEQLIRRCGAMKHEDAVPIFKQALLGIGFAHRMGIVHRDIKPANIMVNGYGIVKVMDFGIAKALSARNLTRTGVSLGTVAYMSPEQIRNSGVDSRSDIYSLGVTLYEMLTAHLPFNSDSDYQIQYDHVNTPPPPLSLEYPYMPGGIEAAVLRAMEKNPADRFAAVEEFGAALEHADVVPEKYSKKAEMPPLVIGAPPKKTLVEAAPAAGLENIGQRTRPERSVPQGALAPKFWTSRNGIITAVAVIAVMAVGFAVAFRPKSPDKPPSQYSGGAGGSSSTVRGIQEQPQESGSGATSTLELPTDKPRSRIEKPNTTTRKRSAPVIQKPPTEKTEAVVTPPPPVVEAQQPARPSVQGTAFTTKVRHRHANAPKGGFFGRGTNAPMLFCIGELTIAPSGSLTYRCTASPNPRGCEPPVSLLRDEIKSASLNNDGSLHIATFARGNYDFYGARSALVKARDAVLTAGR
jgi:serine/threonine protein kinase